MSTQEAFVVSIFFICSTIVMCCIIYNKQSVKSLHELEQQIAYLDADIVRLKVFLRNDVKSALEQMYKTICGNQDS